MHDTAAAAVLDPAMASDPMFAALAGALDGSQPFDPLAMVKAQLESQADPRAAMLIRLLEQRRQQEEAALSRLQEQLHQDADAAPAVAPTGEAQEDLAQVQQAVDAIYAELAALRGRTAALADALGACPACFGDDPLCDTCRGRGVPGARRPDPAAFRKYVRPAVARARAIDSGRTEGSA